MRDRTGNGLAQRSTDANGRADGPKGEIKATRAPREIGDDENRDYAENASADSIQDLNRDQRHRVVSERIQYGANRQNSECDEQQRLSTPCPGFPSRPGSE